MHTLRRHTQPRQPYPFRCDHDRESISQIQTLNFYNGFIEANKPRRHMIKKTLALAFLIATLAIGAFAFGSPPTSTKEKTVAVHAAPTTNISQAETVIAPSFDASLSMPVEQILIAGEKT